MGQAGYYCPVCFFLFLWNKLLKRTTLLSLLLILGLSGCAETPNEDTLGQDTATETNVEYVEQGTQYNVKGTYDPFEGSTAPCGI